MVAGSASGMNTTARRHGTTRRARGTTIGAPRARRVVPFVRTVACLLRAATAAVVPVACGGRDDGARDTVAARAASAAATPAPLPGRPLCLGTGHWEECTLPDRLERAGLVPIPKDTIRRPWLAVPGRTWQLYRGTLHVFRYADSAARARDLATLDTLRGTPRGDTTVAWGAAPVTLLASDNLLAFLVADDGTLVERITLAITAGPTPKAVVPGRP